MKTKILVTLVAFLALFSIGNAQMFDRFKESGEFKLPRDITIPLNTQFDKVDDTLTQHRQELNALNEVLGVQLNQAPTNITVSVDSIIYNFPANTNILSFTATDADVGDSHAFALVAGTGDGDNGNFKIVGKYLQAYSLSDFEDGDSARIRVRATDSKGGTFDKAFALVVKQDDNYNYAPSDVSLSDNYVQEGLDSGSVVCSLSGVDLNSGDTFTFALVAGPGSTHNNQFVISGNQLKTNAVLTSDNTARSIRIRVTDNGGKYIEVVKYITVTQAAYAPTDIYVQTPGHIIAEIDEGNAIGALVGIIDVTDSDDLTHTITKVSGIGDTDNAYFSVRNDSLYADSVFNYDEAATRSVRLRARDDDGLAFEKAITIYIGDTITVETSSVFIHVNFTPSTIYEGDGDFWNNFVGDEVHKSTLLDTLGNEIDISLTLNGLNSSNRSETNATPSLPTIVRQTRFDNSIQSQSGYATIGGMDANQEGTIIYTGYANQVERNGAVYFNDVFMDSIDNQTMSDTVMWNFTADANGELEIHFDPNTTYMYIDYLGIVIGEYGGTLSPGSIEAPSALTLTVDTPDIVLNWVDNSDSGSGFYIYHRLATDSVFTNIDNVAANVTTYTDLSVEEDTAHYYYVVAYNDSLVSSPSETVNGIISTLPPATPTSFQATSFVNSVSLSWDESATANKVLVYRSTNGASYTQIKSLAGNISSYQDLGLTEQTTYYYYIKFENNYGVSNNSVIRTVTTKAQSDRPYYEPVDKLDALEASWNIQNYIYIDTNAPGGGNGTKASPYNTFSYQGGANTKYFVKRGSEIYVSLNGWFDNTIIEAYGPETDPMPIFGGTMNFRTARNSNFYAKDIHFFATQEEGAPAEGKWNFRMYPDETGASGFYLDNCKVLGDPTYPPEYNFYGINEPNIVYHCEVGYAQLDNFLAGNNINSYQVSNWIHHANLASVYNTSAGGDAIQWLKTNTHDTYFANLWIDRSATRKKFCFIASSAEGYTPYGITFEYNTMKVPAKGLGGAGFHSGLGTSSTFRHNTIWSWEDNTDVSVIYSYKILYEQDYPLGLHSNALIVKPSTTARTNMNEATLLASSVGNRWFDTWSDWATFKSTNDLKTGSDLDINGDGNLTSTEFWDLWVDPREGGIVTPTINAPTNLTATVSGSDIVLNWLDNSTNETGFAIVHRLDTGSVLVALDSVAANVTTYTMANANVDTTHYFGVYAFNSTLDSDTSNIVNISITTAVPAKPVNVVAEAQADGQSIVLSWGTLPLANKYYIRKSTDNVTFYNVKNVTAPQTSWEDINVNQTTTYYYDVQGYNNFGYGEYSDTVSATVPIPTETAYNIPTRPTAGDWGITDTLYIDGNAAGGGDGSIETPYNVFADQGGSKTLYYIKRGTTIPAVESFSDSIIWEPYGSGAQPIVSGKSGFMFADNDYFVADSIHFYAPSYEAAVIRLRGNDGSHNYGTDNQQYFWFFNCQVLGNPADPASRGFSGAGPNTTIYHCEIGNTKDDGIWGSDWTNGKIVSNWIHDVGLGNPTDEGDGLHIPWNNAQNLYVANNFIDHSAAPEKYCIIVNNGFQYGATNNRIVYNTLKSPATGYGAAIIKTGLGNQGTVYKNILYGWEDSNVAFFHSYDSEVLQSDPYGVKDNVLIGTNPIMADAGGVTNATTMLSLQFNSTVYANWNAWRTLWLSSGQPSYGSDLDDGDGTITKDEFWGTATP